MLLLLLMMMHRRVAINSINTRMSTCHSPQRGGV